jgi:hypothetical protein
VDNVQACGLGAHLGHLMRHDEAPVRTTPANDAQGAHVTDLPVPKASRLRRPGWRDLRLVVGVLLVLASVVLGSYVVAHADDRTAMYAAAGPLVPGQRLTEADLMRVEVQLGSKAPTYLSAAQGLAPDRYVLTEVRAGELVPAAAVGGHADIQVQPLTLLVDGGSAASLRVGSRVDVYVNPTDPDAGAATAKKFTGPELALQGVSVAGLPHTASGFGGSATGDRPVQVMAPTDRIKDIIGKVDLGARVTVVPVAGSTLQGDQ